MDDLGLLLEELQDVCRQWYYLGLQLKMRTETLDTIKAQFSDSRKRLREMLKTWLATRDNPSWKALTDALRSMGQSWLTGDLERKYCLTEEESKH